MSPWSCALNLHHLNYTALIDDCGCLKKSTSQLLWSENIYIYEVGSIKTASSSDLAYRESSSLPLPLVPKYVVCE